LGVHRGEWATYPEQHGSTVAFDIVEGVRVSTAFMSNLTDREAAAVPLLAFETMILDGPHCDEAVRYETWEDAEAGHHSAIARLDTLARSERSEAA
jgi:hypothetical protein